MAFSPKLIFNVLKSAGKDFMDDDCPRMAAALSYYTIFSLPPLLVIIVTILGAVYGEEAARGQLSGQVSGLLGPAAAAEFETMIQNAGQKTQESTGIIATVLGIAALLFGATGAFIQLQDALNTAWEVEPDPNKGGIKNVILKRVLSFGMILGVGFLLLVSLVISAALAAFGGMLERVLPDALSGAFLHVLNFVVSFGVISFLFAALYKVLPDARVGWRDVWIGAVVTALLFTIGKFALGFYLGNGDVGSAYGAAGSLALILVWIYYSSMILFFGAEFTQAWVDAHGRTIMPDKDAVKVIVERKQVQVPGSTPAPNRTNGPGAPARRRG